MSETTAIPPPTPTSTQARRKVLPPSIAIALLACLVVSPFVVTLAIHKGSSHDEHQHIAAGMLLAREGLLPYKDYPYFHTPYLVFAYGALFEFTSHPLLVARLFSAVCATLTLGLIFWLSLYVFRSSSPRMRIGVATAAVLLVLTSPLFTYTVGKAWNQEPSVLLTVVAILLHLSAARNRHVKTFLFLSGLSLAMAIGTRITVAPLALPFVSMIAFLPKAQQQRSRLFAAFAFGLAVGSLPLFLSFCLAPKQFLFGNLEFAQVNVIYRENVGQPRTMTILTKLRYFAKNVAPRNFAVTLLAIGCCVVYVRGAAHRANQDRFELRFLLMLFPFVLAGCFAPSPLYFQYFFICAPLVVLTCVQMLTALDVQSREFRHGLVVFTSCAAISAIANARNYNHFFDLFRPEQWEPLKTHQSGVELLRLTGAGRVLTLAPTVPLEGGLSIYPSFATGPFAWRVAPFVAASRRKELGIISQDELEDFLTANPPQAILTGYEKERWEKPLVEYAQSHGYEAVPHAEDKIAWLPPKRSSLEH